MELPISMRRAAYFDSFPVHREVYYTHSFLMVQCALNEWKCWQLGVFSNPTTPPTSPTLAHLSFVQNRSTLLYA